MAEAAGAQVVSQQFDGLAGLVCPGAHVKSDITALGRGLVAQQDLPAGTTVLVVDSFNLLCVTDEPLKTGNSFGKALLTDFQLLHGDLPPLLSSYLLSSRGTWFTRLAAWLLWLSRHGGGVWQLYTQMLPKEADMGSLMNFTPEERHELQCMELQTLAEQERSAIQNLHDSVFSSYTGDLRTLDLAPTLQDTLWAACMVGRELLSLMVPCCDMANHSMDPNATYKLDPASNTFQITLTQDVAAGNEVLISYLGSKPDKNNRQLMKDYGFVLPGNTSDLIEFETTEEAAAKRRQQAVLKSLKPFVQLGSVSAGMEQQPAAQQQLAQELLSQCQVMTSRFATSLQEDQALLAGARHQQVSGRYGAAVRARVEQKVLLLTAEQLLKAYAKSLE
eukprot:gene3651-3912_t